MAEPFRLGCALFASRKMESANYALHKHYRTGKGCRTAGLNQ